MATPTLLDDVNGLLSFLEQAEACMTPEAFAGAQESHLLRLKNKISSVRELGTGLAASVIARLRDSRLPSSAVGDLVALLQTATEVRMATVAFRQGQTQDFRCFARYMTAHVWGVLHSPGFRAMDVHGALAGFLGSLGCVVPSESTIQHFCSAALLLTEASSLMTMTADEKHKMYEQQKVWLRGKLKAEYSAHPDRAGWPHIHALPWEPSLLPAQWQGDRIFGRNEGASWASWASEVAVLAATIPMRSTHCSLQKRKSSNADGDVASKLLEAMTKLVQGPATGLQKPTPKVMPGSSPDGSGPTQMDPVRAPSPDGFGPTQMVPVKSPPPCQPAVPNVPEQPAQSPSSCLAEAPEVPEQAGHGNKAFKILSKLAPTLVATPARCRVNGKQSPSSSAGSSRAEVKPKLRDIKLQPKPKAANKKKALQEKNKEAKQREKKKQLKLQQRRQTLREAGVPQKLIDFRRKGCSRCRKAPGCSQTCWRKRGFNVTF